MKLLFSLFLSLFASRAALAAAPPSADQAEAVKGSNAFAVDLYGRLSAQPGNLFFSPESISTAFAMTYAGAHGQTATEMARVFHFTLPPDRLHPAIGALLAGMNAPHPGYALSVADALWAEKDENFLPAYLKLVETNYAAGFHPVDFKTAPDSVRATINQWVEKQTNNKIQNLLGPGTVTPLSRLFSPTPSISRPPGPISSARTQPRTKIFTSPRARPLKRPQCTTQEATTTSKAHLSRRSCCLTRRTKSRC